MLRTTLGLMKKNIRMLIPSGIAILIGATFISATFLFTGALANNIGKTLTQDFADATIVVTPDEKIENPTFQSLHTQEIEKVKDVIAVTPEISAFGTVANTRNETARTLFTAKATNPKLQTQTLKKGKFPTKSNEVTIPESLSKSLQLSIGDTLHAESALSNNGNKTLSNFTITGITHECDRVNCNAPVFTLEGLVKNRLLPYELPAKPTVNDVTVYQLLVLTNNNPNTIEAAQQQIEKVVPKNVKVQTREEYNKEQMKQISNSIDVVQVFLLAFGALAMFVASMVIANTFQILVAQRRKIFGLLRVIGTSKGQVYRSVVCEALLLGLISSIFGVILAIILMLVITHFMHTDVTLQAMLGRSYGALYVPVIFAITITMLASLSAARMATRVSALEALRPMSQQEDKKTTIIRLISGIIFLVAGVFGAAWSTITVNNNIDHMSASSFTSILSVAIVGCAAIFIALIVLAPYWLVGLNWLVGACVTRLGATAQVAVANIRRNSRRVAATGVALLIGVTLVSTVITGAESGKATLHSKLDNTFSVDFLISGNVTKEDLNTFKHINGVKEGVFVTTIPAILQDKTTKVQYPVYLMSATIDQLNTVSNAKIPTIHADENTVIVPKNIEKVAVLHDEVHEGQSHEDTHSDNSSEKKTYPIKTNNSFSLKSVSDNGEQPVHVTVIPHLSFNPTDVPVLVSDKVFNNPMFAQERKNQILLKTTSDANPMSIYNELQTKVKDGTEILSPDVLRQGWENAIDATMQVLLGLIIVAVLIAIVGVSNTLSLSVIERTHESATLRAIGMSKRQLRASIAIEALMIAIISGISGIILGTTFGWIGSNIVFSSLSEPILVLPWKMHAYLLFFAIVAALLASLAPARRAVKTPPVQALSEE